MASLFRILNDGFCFLMSKVVSFVEFGSGFFECVDLGFVWVFWELGGGVWVWFCFWVCVVCFSGLFWYLVDEIRSF